ncbi:9-O-acetylesterase [bacterium]|nr:9-O-acetylesterase [bacterium]
MISYLRLFLAIFTACVSVASADVRLHPLFSDHAVLQREIPVPVWGVAAPGEKVTIAFAGQKVAATADSAGRWRVTLAPLAASFEPQELVARAANTVTVSDVLVGDVWLASGQSNMDSPLSSGSAAEALPAATDTTIRFFKVTKTVAPEPLAEPKGKWEPSTPEAAKGFSAVAYFFAREIRCTQSVPVAVLNAAWGGTPIVTWMTLDSIRRDPPVAKTLADWESALARHREVKDRPALMEAYRIDMKDWETNVGPAHKAAAAAHAELASAARAAGQPVPPAPQIARPEPVQPDPMAHPSASKRPNTPTISFNGMIAPLAPFALRGVLWYQGEADGSKGADYRVWFPRLIEGWRAAWDRPLPFVFVQLPGCYADDEPVSTKGWAFLREAQASALALPSTAMAVTSDIGDPKDVHPDNKIHVGHRVALAARERVYGEKVIGTGPLYAGHVVEGGTVRIKFSDTRSSLVIGRAPWVSKIAKPLPDDRLVGFYVAGSDRVWVEAEARIEGNTVLVSAQGLAAPVAVRYAWAAFPRANLTNREGLPAASFRTDDWPQ